MFIFSALGGDLGGEKRLISSWIADWRRMYDFPAGGKPGLAAPDSGVNMAMRIDTRLTDPLEFLPPSTFGGNENASLMRRNLAFRNLARGNLVRLASGQQMVTRLKSKGVNVTPLTRAQILNGSGGAKLDHLTAAEKNAVAEQDAAVVLHPARGRAEQRPAQGGRCAHRRRDLPPRDGGQQVLDRARHRLPADPGPAQGHVRDDRPAALHLRHQSRAGASRMSTMPAQTGDQGVGGLPGVGGTGGTRGNWGTVKGPARSAGPFIRR